MKCSDNEQFSNSLVQKKNNKKRQRKHRPLQNSKVHVESGAMKE